jgi:hypothetical protein
LFASDHPINTSGSAACIEQPAPAADWPCYAYACMQRQNISLLLHHFSFTSGLTTACYEVWFVTVGEMP